MFKNITLIMPSNLLNSLEMCDYAVYELTNPIVYGNYMVVINCSHNQSTEAPSLLSSRRSPDFWQFVTNLLDLLFHEKSPDFW